MTMTTTKENAMPTAKDIDRHVGQRIRERRTMLGITQQQLAEQIGVTYQQAHKYERGINRVAAGRLYIVASALGVEVGFFYEGMAESSALSEGQRMCLDVARNFSAIKGPEQRAAVSQLCRALAGA